MIDINLEKQSKLTTQEIYDILYTAIENSDDNGFMNSYVFQHACYVYAAIALYPENKGEWAEMVEEINPLNTFYKLMQDGVIDKLQEEYPLEMNLIADLGAQWYEEYTEFLHSVRGVFQEFQKFSGDIMESAAKQYSQLKSDERLDGVTKMAKDWGMDEEPLFSLIPTPAE